jgi:hypothetical protein
MGFALFSLPKASSDSTNWGIYGSSILGAATAVTTDPALQAIAHIVLGEKSPETQRDPDRKALTFRAESGQAANTLTFSAVSRQQTSAGIPSTQGSHFCLGPDSNIGDRVKLREEMVVNEDQARASKHQVDLAEQRSKLETSAGELRMAIEAIQKISPQELLSNKERSEFYGTALRLALNKTEAAKNAFNQLVTHFQDGESSQRLRVEAETIVKEYGEDLEAYTSACQLFSAAKDAFAKLQKESSHVELLCIFDIAKQAEDLIARSSNLTVFFAAALKTQSTENLKSVVAMIIGTVSQVNSGLIKNKDEIARAKESLALFKRLEEAIPFKNDLRGECSSLHREKENLELKIDALQAEIEADEAKAASEKLGKDRKFCMQVAVGGVITGLAIGILLDGTARLLRR